MLTLIDCLLDGDAESDRFYRLLDGANTDDLPAIRALATHADAAVRLALVSTLPLVDDDPPSMESVELAIALTLDPDPRVRDHACFVLAEQWQDLDTPAIREALAARLDDLDREVRCEALVGLAYRGDPRALPRVRAALSRPSGDVWKLELVAAGMLGDPSLHPLVLRHLDGWDGADVRTVEAARRLTDPDGPGADLMIAVARLSVDRAHGRADQDQNLAAWRLMSEMLELAPARTRAFYTAVASRLTDDHAALDELRLRSAFTTMLDQPDG